MCSIARPTAIRPASKSSSRAAWCPCSTTAGFRRGATVDELDRLFGLLVAALARETRVAVPFPASEVYERLVPYRSNRSRLNVATHQDYEMAALRLLAGEGSFRQRQPEGGRA